MGRKAKKNRRQSHGSALLWKQTDCWYYTQPGTKKRVALFGDNGERIRGKENKDSEVELNEFGTVSDRPTGRAVVLAGRISNTSPLLDVVDRQP